MLEAYEEDYHTGMDAGEIAALRYEYTSGYPALCFRGRFLEGCQFILETNPQKMYLAFQNCICYNADRQKDMNSPCRTAKSPGVPAPGLFYSLFWQWQGLEP